MQSRIPQRRAILTAKAANGVGTTMMVNDFQNIVVQIATTGSATLTVKVQGSLADPKTPPDFASAATAANPWTFIAAYDFVDPTSVIAGGTGIATTATDIVKNILVNTKGLVHLNLQGSGWSVGTVSATAITYNNQ